MKSRSPKFLYKIIINPKNSSTDCKKTTTGNGNLQPETKVTSSRVYYSYRCTRYFALSILCPVYLRFAGHTAPAVRPQHCSLSIRINSPRAPESVTHTLPAAAVVLSAGVTDNIETMRAPWRSDDELNHTSISRTRAASKSPAPAPPNTPRFRRRFSHNRRNVSLLLPLRKLSFVASSSHEPYTDTFSEWHQWRIQKICEKERAGVISRGRAGTPSPCKSV